MREHSLTRRLVLLVLVVELLCAGAFSALSLWHEWTTRLHALDVVLQGRSDSLLGAIQDAEDPADNVFVDPAELKLPEEDLFSVYNQAGTLLGGTERNVPSLTQLRGDGVRTQHFGGQSYRVLERKAMRIIDRAETGGHGIRRPVTIVYATPVSTAHIWHEIVEAAGFYITAGLVFATFSSLVLLVLIRRYLQPLQELAIAAAGVTPGTLTFDPPESAARVLELRPLVQALSATITGLRQAFEKQHRFVSDAAHELKTAVAVVRSSIQLLSLKSRTAEEYRSGLQALLADNERVEELVGRMLFLAHMEEHSDASASVCDAGQVVSQASASLTSYATAHGLALQVTCAETMSVALPAEDLRTVITNLIANAIQHSNKASNILVRVRQSEKDSAQAILEVQDFGEGIEAKDMPFIFDRFYRADVSRSRETGGAGLGLAICRSIVDGVGGQITLESTPGLGTTARVTLPLATVSLPHTAEQTAISA